MTMDFGALSLMEGLEPVLLIGGVGEIAGEPIIPP